MGLKLQDHHPEMRNKTVTFVDFIFKFAEQLLVVGIFSFLGQATGHWAVITIYVILHFLLAYSIFTTLNSYLFSAWGNDEKLWKVVVWRAADLLIFGALLFTLHFAINAVVKAMKAGMGV